MAIQNDFKMVKEMLHEAMETVDFEKRFVVDECETNHFDLDKFKELLTNLVESSDEEETSEEIYDTFAESNSAKSVWNTVHISQENEEEVCTLEEKEKLLKETGIDIIHLIRAELSVKDINKEYDQALTEHVNYLTSPEYDAKRVEMMHSWEKRLETESDPIKIAELKHNIQMVKERFSLGYMFARINNPKTHDADMKSLLDTFFDDAKSRYTIHRFTDKARQMKFNPLIYRHFFNIEEKYLEKKYHVFNNFFLLAAMRFIAHADSTRELIESRTIINNLINLSTDRFATEEGKNLLLNSIRSFLDQFIDAGWSEKFEKDNILQPNHPVRIEKERKREEALRKNLMDEIEKNDWITSEEERAEVEGKDINELLTYIHLKEAEDKAREEELANQISEELDDECNDGSPNSDFEEE